VELWDRADLLVSSQLVYPEARAALAAAARAGRIDESTHASAVATLEDLYAQLRIIAIDEPLARQAGDLAAQHALRGYDAVHLACALHLEGDDILLATWDNALNSAARATGQLIANDTGSDDRDPVRDRYTPPQTSPRKSPENQTGPSRSLELRGSDT
jgi:uncharacterized protein